MFPDAQVVVPLTCEWRKWREVVLCWGAFEMKGARSGHWTWKSCISPNTFHFPSLLENWRGT